mgnify:CR=1 FL=1
MYFLIYASTARPHLDEAELNRLVSRSEQFNASVGITGLLMRDGDRLTQLVEGPEGAVRDLADRISKDTRHSGYTVLIEGPTAEAAFPHWSLQLASTDRLARLESKDDPIRVYLKAVRSRMSNHRHRRAIEHLLEFESPPAPIG